MDALLTAFLACLLVEAADRSQRLALVLSRRFGAGAAVIAGIIVAAFANAALSAAGGWWLAPMLGSHARSLFLALALLMAGAGLLLPVGRTDPLAGWRIGGFATTALGLFILGFGNGTQMLTLAVVVRMGHPVLAAAGAGLAVMLACLAAVGAGRPVPDGGLARAVRYTGGGLLLLTGAAMGLAAVGLA